MKIKEEWIENLHRFKSLESQIIFNNCQTQLFDKGLELGAGDGFQSIIISNYVKELISTEISQEVFKLNNNNITYKLCDAENIEQYFKSKQFDLIFSSNLFEHLPNPKKALIGMDSVLKDDGIMIHVMPTTFWKFWNLSLYHINLLITLIELKTEVKGIEKTNQVIINDNNPKLLRNKRPLWQRLLIPEPHGVSPNNISEFFCFRKKHWISFFENAGFTVVKVKKGPVSTGYGFGFKKLEDIFYKLGFCSEFIYIVKKNNSDSKYLKYF